MLRSLSGAALLAVALVLLSIKLSQLARPAGLVTDVVPSQWLLSPYFHALYVVTLLALAATGVWLMLPKRRSAKRAT